MQRTLPLGLALAAALLLPGCGSSNPELIPQDRADQLTQTLDEVAVAHRATRTATAPRTRCVTPATSLPSSRARSTAS